MHPANKREWVESRTSDEKPAMKSNDQLARKLRTLLSPVPFYSDLKVKVTDKIGKQTTRVHFTKPRQKRHLCVPLVWLHSLQYYTKLIYAIDYATEYQLRKKAVALQPFRTSNLIGHLCVVALVFSG